MRPPAAQLERARRSGGYSCKPGPGLQQQDRERAAGASDCNLEPGGIPRLRLHTGSRVSGPAASTASESRDGAEVDGRSQAVAGQAETHREGAYLASAAQPLRRAGAMGHQRARLAGRAWSQVVFDQHDRRRYQPPVGGFCGARLDSRKHVPVRKLRAKARPAGELLHRQSELVCDVAENRARRTRSTRCCGTASHPDWARTQRAGYRVDRGPFAASQRSHRARLCHRAGPAGERLASGPRTDAGTKRMCI